MNISHSLIRSLHCLNPATITSVLFAARPYLDLHTAKTIATSIVHSKLDYCDSLYYGLPKYQINRLQHFLNALARTVVQTPKFQHITSILKSLHWLKDSERIEYKIISLTKFSIGLPLSHGISMTSYSASSRSQHTLFTLCHSDQTIVITQSHPSILHLIFGTNFTQSSSSELLIPSQRPSLNMPV